MKFLMRLLVVVLLLINASFAQNLQKISLQLQWKYQFQFAGFIVAKERGYYKEQGLDVTLLEYENGNTMQDLSEGKVDFAVSNGMIAFADKKLYPVSLIATYFQRSPLVLITQPSIKTALDLKGKRISIGNNDLGSSSLSLLFEYFSITKENSNFEPFTFNLNCQVSPRCTISKAIS